MQMNAGAARLLSPSEGANYKRGLLAQSEWSRRPVPPCAPGRAGSPCLHRWDGLGLSFQEPPEQRKVAGGRMGEKKDHLKEKKDVFLIFVGFFSPFVFFPAFFWRKMIL